VEPVPTGVGKVRTASTPSPILQFTAAEIFGTGWNRSLPGVVGQGRDGFHAVPNVAIYGGRNIWDRVEPVPTGVDEQGKDGFHAVPNDAIYGGRDFWDRVEPVPTGVDEQGRDGFHVVPNIAIYGTQNIWDRVEPIPTGVGKVGMASTPSLMLQFTAAEIFGTGWNRSLPGVDEQGRDGFHVVPDVAIYGGRDIWDRVEPVPTGAGKVGMASTPSPILQFTAAEIFGTGWNRSLPGLAR
jgi:hypothetical protein